MSMSMCPGRFSTETLKLLQDAAKREGLAARETILPYACIVCGRAGLMALIDGNEWRPASHEPPARKTEKSPSGSWQRTRFTSNS